MVSAQSSEGTDLRPGRYDDLAALTDSEADRAAELQARVGRADRGGRATSPTRSTTTPYAATRRRSRSSRTRPASPSSTGPGVVVTLSDAPDEVVDAATGDKNLLVVHQQDIQAVVNAMWEGGAEAVDAPGPAHGLHHRHQVRGQLGACSRACPTRSPTSSRRSVTSASSPAPSPTTTTCRSTASRPTTPTIAVGWDLDIADEITAPAYDGLLDLSYATPVNPSAQRQTPRTVARPSRRRTHGRVSVASAGSSAVGRRRGRLARRSTRTG